MTIVDLYKAAHETELNEKIEELHAKSYDDVRLPVVTISQQKLTSVLECQKAGEVEIKKRKQLKKDE